MLERLAPAEVLKAATCLTPDVLEIRGPSRLSGAVTLEGCKLASVTMMAAALLTDDEVVLRRCPDLLDQRVLGECLSRLGGTAAWSADRVHLRCAGIEAGADLPAELIGAVHGTIYLLPALLARNGVARIARSRGGCDIGVRPISNLADILRALGAKVRLGETIEARAPAGGLVGKRLRLDYGEQNNKFISGATKAAILAGVTARGETIIEGAYWRHPIVQLCGLLRAMGAEIEGDGTRCIRIRGVPTLHGADFSLDSDRLVLGTYVAAAAVGGGPIRCTPASLSLLEVEAGAFRRMGMSLDEDDGSVVASFAGRPRPAALTTETIDTDLGPMFAVLMTLAAGRSSLEDVVWERRFRYAGALRRMGGDNACSARMLNVTGVPALRAARVHAHDLRAAAALILAAIAATGTTRLAGAAHLARGYENLPKVLNMLGADIRTVWRDAR